MSEAKEARTRYRGVWSCRYKYSRKFTAKLKHHSETVNLGYFDNEVIAAMRYDAAVILLRGEQEPAALNFPDGIPPLQMEETRAILQQKGLLPEDGDA